MEKNIFLAVLVFLVSFGGAFGQVQNSTSRNLITDDPKALFERTAGVIDLTKPNAVEDHVQMMKGGADFGPGDHPVFLTHSSKEFARRGEVVDINLVSMINAPREEYVILGMIIKPGLNGEYDGSIPPGYFYADTDYVKGITMGQTIKVHSRMFNPEDNFGKHQITFLVYDARSGVLIQQVWLTVNLVDSGTFDPTFFTRSIAPARNGTGLVATGRYPIGIPIYYMVGVLRYGFGFTGDDPRYAAYSTNGRTVNLDGRMFFNKTTSVDVMMWSPFTREAIVKPNAMVEVAPSPVTGELIAKPNAIAEPTSPPQ